MLPVLCTCSWEAPPWSSIERAHRASLENIFCPPCRVAWACKTYPWQKVALPHCAGDLGHCLPYRSRSQNDLQSATGLRTLLVQSEMCWSPGWHYCDKTSTGSGESLSGPHSEVLIHLPPQPGSWRSSGWGQGKTLELGENKKSIEGPIANIFMNEQKIM